jgi:primosomal protein N' (replication factor Y) (superfamily II helicase)
MLFADVAIPVTIDKLFTYIVPEELQPLAKPGVRALVPFGKRTVIGIILAVSPTDKTGGVPLKAIRDLVDFEPVLSADMLELAKWMAEYYFASLGDVLKTVLFQGSTRPPKRSVRLLSEDIGSLYNEISKSSIKTSIIRELENKDALSIAQLQKRINGKNIYSALIDLADMGAIAIEQEENKPPVQTKQESFIIVNDEWKARWQALIAELQPSADKKRTARQIEVLTKLLSLEEDTLLNTFKKNAAVSIAALQKLAKTTVIEITKKEVVRAMDFDEYSSGMPENNLILNPHQTHAVEEIGRKAKDGTFHTFLLHGVTGSGKTQVYIETIRPIIEQGKSAIVLVPEISLTSQIVRRFRRYFGDTVAALHSRMTPGERFDAWRLAHEGKCSIVIGPRSAIFAPLKNLAIIVVDEEHESAYKQFDQMPRYHARDVAIVRGKIANAVVVLGSATPSFESYANVADGKHTLLELPERIDNAKLPIIEIVDLLDERKQKYAAYKEEYKQERDQAKAASLPEPKYMKFEMGAISDRLKYLIDDRLRKGEGIILLQNRRGFAPIIECPDCGNVEMCENCHISMTYHATKREIRCHYCGMVKNPPDACAQCGSIDLDYKGFGTQRVEDELKKEFPGAKLIRMDLDTTSKRGSHDALLKKFAEGDADILLGTQMVAKGLDFSRVSLVGVISADTQMLLPDFRSSERTFQLLTQVSGRAGRSTIAGEVVIQTLQPKHPSLNYVIRHDFKAFFDEEMTYRNELNYPPFSRIVLVEFNGKEEKAVMNASRVFVDLLKPYRTHFIILGPAPAAITKLKTLYRWHVVIKDVKSSDPSGVKLHRAIRQVMEAYKKSPVKNIGTVRIIIDADPVGMM